MRGDDSERKKRLVFARVVGYLLLEGPSDKVRATVASEVVSAKNMEDRFKLGEMYFNHYIRCFRKYKGRTPTPSEHPSRPCFDALKQEIRHEIMEPPKDHSTAKKLANGYRCIITHRYDLNCAKEDEKVMHLANQPGAGLVFTQCAHIFPSLTNTDTSDSRGHGDKELNDANIHRLENIMTLELDFHSFFDTLDAWLEEQSGQPHTYKVKFRFPAVNVDNRDPKLIVFESMHNNLPLPSPTYLEIHAACAKVCHLSGAAEYIDKYEREMEDIKVLSNDGTSADILHHALQSLSSEVSVF
ncbi:hypothetical protein BU17DRAFT_76064 [Hysterangium stoloniferum]|nr:hypothetical protein BU17DRAFT_76064 [Hysterangium stoloniferum]